MSRSMNKVMILGNLGKDPELKYTPSGIAVCSFSIATSEEWKDAEGVKQEKTEWHNITAWRKVAELCGEYLRKGSKVMVEGKLQTRSYEKDGVKRYITEIVIDEVIFLDGKKEGSGSPESSQAKETPGKSSSEFDDDKLPF